MADATFEFVKPFSGGGLGDCKIGIIKFDGGTYVADGFKLGLTAEPLMMIAGADLVSGGQPVFAKFSPELNTVKLYAPGVEGGAGALAELTGASKVEGTLMIVVKGAL